MTDPRPAGCRRTGWQGALPGLPDGERRLPSLRPTLAAVLAALFVVACAQPATVETPAPAAEDTLPDGARWIAEVPGNWNGSLLLYAHGYSRELEPPVSAPESVRQTLLERGFALAASAYPSAGWAVAQAVPSQLHALDAFEKQYGAPAQVIAWGSSMGGLVTSALAQDHADRLDGALTLCASSMGAVPMMNMAFDGAFVLTTLVPADPPVPVAGAGDNMDGVKRQMAAVAAARETAAGRARVALAGVLGGIPGWTRPDHPRPAADDFRQQEEEMAAAVQWGLFLPRGDQERRAGGVFSGNDGIDYAALLDASGRSALVRALYADAALDLDADLERLAQAPRVAAEAVAVDYMRQNFTPSGRVGVPVLSVHTLGDGLTSPSLQRSYVDKVRAAGFTDRIAALWIDRAGHCTQSADEMLAALEYLRERIARGAWPSALPGSTDNVRFVATEATPVPRAALLGAGSG